MKSTLKNYKEFCTNIYDPESPIVLWALASVKGSENLANWNKSMKPNSREFKTFREMHNWVQYKEDFLVTLEAQNLTHLIDLNFVITDHDLDAAQSALR